MIGGLLKKVLVGEVWERLLGSHKIHKGSAESHRKENCLALLNEELSVNEFFGITTLRSILENSGEFPRDLVVSALCSNC